MISATSRNRRVTILNVVEVVGAEIPGLRERKKQRTRSMLIDAAVELCDKQGFDNTTVDQIAAVADVSPRTFSRYFATKDAVILALIDDMTAAIAVQLARQPPELSPLDAMFGAHVAMIEGTATASADGFTTERLKTITRIVNSSPALRLAASDFRDHAVTQGLGERMGVEFDDKRLQLAVAVFATILLSAVDELAAVTDWSSVDADTLVVALTKTYERFTAICADAASRA